MTRVQRGTGPVSNALELRKKLLDPKVIGALLAVVGAVGILGFVIARHTVLAETSAGEASRLRVVIDSETGKVIKTFNIKKYPYCARFNPDEDKQHSFLIASSNKKIGQYDVRSGNRTQQYDEHLGAVNTVTFIDNNRKFVSTSDDKKIFLWEYGIPVVVKHISEPDMHSITATDMNPSRKYFIGQSSENKVKLISENHRLF